MVDLDQIAIDLIEAARDNEEVTQARISLMVQNDEGFVTEQVYTIRYYEDRDGRPGPFRPIRSRAKAGVAKRQTQEA